MNIVILGPGAIGSLWACYLHRAGHKVSLWSRSSDQAISLTLDDGLPITFTNHNIQAVRQADLLLVTVKAWQVEAAMKPLLDELNLDCMLLFMHNGMGAMDALAESLSPFPVLMATTTHGAFKPTDTQVRHTGQGQTLIGGFNTRGRQCQFLADVLSHALPETGWHPDIRQALWHKLAINCAINPLTAILQCRNGELDQDDHQPVLTRLTHELAAVMTAEGIPTQPGRLSEQIHQVINATAENFSSMHQDIFYRRQTEIDFITGYLLKIAARHQIDVPENRRLYESIKQLENQ